MEALFIKLFNISITASFLILAVILLRPLLKGAPKSLRYVLWLMVGLRLICPISFESVLSLIPSAEVVPQNILYAEAPEIQSGLPVLNAAVNPIISEAFKPEAAASVNPMQVVIYISSIIWIIGLSAMLLYFFISYFYLSRKLVSSILLRDNIWQSENVSSPFILGVIKPKIYIPFNLDDEAAKYIISHESAHIKGRDHLIKPFAFLILSIYWFNPLVWLSYILLCRDIELSCDEKVIKSLGLSEKKAYSMALLKYSAERKMLAACPLAFGEVGTKERVKNILNYRKPAFWVIFIGIFSCAALAVCFLTNPKKTIPLPVLNDVSYISVDQNNGGTSVSGIMTTDDKEGIKEVLSALNGAYLTNRAPADKMPEAKSLDGENFFLIRLFLKTGEETVYLYSINGKYYLDIPGGAVYKTSRSASIAIAKLYSEDTYPRLFAGEYTPDKLIFLSSWNSSTPDYYLERHSESKFIISADIFKATLVDLLSSAWPKDDTYDSPKYVPLELQDKLEVMSSKAENAPEPSTIDVSEYETKICYEVFSSDGEDTGYRIFRMDGETWIGHWAWYGTENTGWWCEYIFKVTPDTPGEEIGASTQKLSLIPASGLSSDNSIGSEVTLDYADDNIVIFHGCFGLFIYDLNEGGIIPIDIINSLGIKTVGGSEGAIVSVSSDGNLLLLASYNETKGTSDYAFYIDTKTGSFEYREYAPLENPFNSFAELPKVYAEKNIISQAIKFPDGYAGITCISGNLDGLKYVRGNKDFLLFESFFK